MNSVALNGNNVKISVSVFLFKEGEVYIAYCPSLDLSGYDVTEENAKVDFEYMLKDWLKTIWASYRLKGDMKHPCVVRPEPVSESMGKDAGL